MTTFIFVNNLADKGYKVIETKSVRKSIKGRSTESINQAKEIESLYLDKDVKAIICAAGGDFLIEILPNSLIRFIFLGLINLLMTEIIYSKYIFGVNSPH